MEKEFYAEEQERKNSLNIVERFMEDFDEKTGISKGKMKANILKNLKDPSLK